MSEWTLGAVRESGMKLEASCKDETCRRFSFFNLDVLIESVGADFLVSDIPPLDCEACGGPLTIALAMLHSEGESDA